MQLRFDNATISSSHCINAQFLRAGGGYSTVTNRHISLKLLSKLPEKTAVLNVALIALAYNTGASTERCKREKEKKAACEIRSPLGITAT